jgi:hypothetical protein
LISFATQFDASLIVYNLEACRRKDRFKVTVPDRLVAAVAAGIPIAIPEADYDACEEYLANFRAVIPFRSTGELKDQLSDRARMQALKLMAWEDSRLYAGEDHLDPLVRLIAEVGPSG